jgi:hypothetical protein
VSVRISPRPVMWQFSGQIAVFADKSGHIGHFHVITFSVNLYVQTRPCTMISAYRVAVADLRDRWAGSVAKEY